jgi:hypothetical protein
MKLLYDNKIDDATLTSSSVDGAFPLANIKRLASTDEFRSSSGTASGTISIDLGSAQACDFVAATGNVYERILAGETITLTGGNDPTTVIQETTAPAQYSDTALSAASFLSSVFVEVSDTTVFQCFINSSTGNRGEFVICNRSGSVLTPQEMSNVVVPKTEQTFLNSNLSSLSVTTLTATKNLACYCDEANSQLGTALVVNTSDDTITPAATPFVFSTGAVTDVCVSALSNLLAIVCFCDVADGGKGKARILSISTDTITAGAVFEFSTAATSIYVSSQYSNSGAIVFRESNGNGKAIKFSVTGTTISAPSNVTFSTSTNVTQITGSIMNYNTFAVFFRDGDDGNKGKIVTISLSGAFAILSTLVFSDNPISSPTARRLDDLRAIVAYRDDTTGTGKSFILNRTALHVLSKGATKELSTDTVQAEIHMSAINLFEGIACYQTSTHGKSVGLRFAGDVISVGASATFHTGALDKIVTTKQDATQPANSGGIGVLAFYRASSIGKANRITMTGNVFEPKFVANLSACLLDSTHVLLCYRDISAAAGVARVITLPGTVGTPLTFEASYPQNIVCAASSASNACAIYFYNNTDGRAVGFSYTGGVLTVGSAVLFHASASLHSGSIAPLSAGKYFVASGATNGESRVCILNVSGTTLTANTQAVLASSTQKVTTRMLSDSKVLLVFSCYIGAYRLRAVTVAIAGNACTISSSQINIVSQFVGFFDIKDFFSDTLVSFDDTVTAGGKGAFCLLSVSGETITPGAITKFSTRTDTITSITTLSAGTSVFTIYRHLDIMRYVFHSMDYQFSTALTVYPTEALAHKSFSTQSFRYWMLHFTSARAYYGCSSLFLGASFAFTDTCFNTQLTIRESDLSTVRFSPIGRRFIDEQTSRVKTLDLSLSALNKVEASQWRAFWNDVGVRKPFFLSVDETFTVLNEPMILAGKFMFNEGLSMSQQTFGLWESSFTMTEVM